MIALEVTHVSKNYPLNASQWGRFRHVFARAGTHIDKGLWALRDVSFRVEKGEAFGIVGANGSGKSTLLQIVAGILRPTSGTVEAHGRLSALLELGSGFAPEFTGRQNVFVNASILGLSHKETEVLFPTIERFAAIGDFIDQPIRTYSTGMVLRLAFAVVAHVEPEILIVDEALAVGDIAFRQRCMRRIHELRAGGTTILFVSHDTGDVKALCERSLWLENGELRMIGDSDRVVAGYLSATIQREHERDAATRIEPAGTGPQRAPEVVSTVSGRHRFGNGGALITGAEVTTSSGEPAHVATARAAVVLRVTFEVQATLPSPMVGYMVRNEKGETIFGTNTARENYPLPVMAAGDVHTIDFHWIMPDLAAGRYFVSIAVSDGAMEHFEVCDYVEDAIAFTAPESGADVAGYLRLPCAAITVNRS